MTGAPDGAAPDRVEEHDQTTPLRGLRAVAGEDFSFADAVGGTRGLVESSVPGLVFVVVYVATRALVPSLVASLAVAVAAGVVRLVQRTPITQALSGVIGVVVGVAWALWTGRAQDYFAGGLLANVGYLVAMVVSVAVRWPLSAPPQATPKSARAASMPRCRTSSRRRTRASPITSACSR